MAKATRLLIVRHGKTDSNCNHRLDGQSDSQLTEEGKKQCKHLKVKLKKYKIDCIYTSPLKRALQTAQIINEQNKPMHIVNEFIEIDCGLCTGLTKQEIKKRFPKLVSEWKRNTDPPFPGGESLRDVEQRAIVKIKEILSEQKGKNILIVGHGALNVAIIGYFLKIPYGLRFKIKQDNCCLNEISIEDETFQIQKINEPLAVRF